MSLRLQLLAFVALTLFLPWAGIRLVTSMEESLRSLVERQMQESATRFARDLAASESFRERNSPRAGLSEPLYLHPLIRQPLLNGTRFEWEFAHVSADEPDGRRAIELADGSRVWLGVHALSWVYLYIEVSDDSVVHQQAPGRAPHGDRVVLIFGEGAGSRRTMLLSSYGTSRDARTGLRAGSIRGQRSPGGDQYVSSGELDELVSGYWADGTNGYVVEARLPLRLIDGALGIGVIDSDEGDATARLAASTWNETGAPNALIHETPELAADLRRQQQGNDRVRVIDGDGWVLADSGPLELAPVADPDYRPPLIERFFRYILRREDPEYADALVRIPGRITEPAMLRALDGEEGTAWYRRGTDVNAIVAVAVPIDPNSPGRGAVIVEQASDPILSLTNREALRLITTTILVSLIAAALLFAYASLLSFRIRRLARAAESALGPRGEIRATLPGNRARDEIGGLARSFQDLLGRLRDYTDYLQTLKSKLSHELRTPLAIVATSIDNLEHETRTEAGEAYIARIRQGTERLESILQAMTAATRVEQAIRQTEFEPFDLGAVIESCIAAYRDVYPKREFVLRVPPRPVPIEGSAELIAQLLDKLIDNAVGFARDGTPIEIDLETTAGVARLQISNRGPLLPEAMRHQLFDSLVSVRTGRGEKPHLGLGLYIVSLIAEFHRGTVAADNLDDGSGVRFSIELPCSGR